MQIDSVEWAAFVGVGSIASIASIDGTEAKFMSTASVMAIGGRPRESTLMSEISVAEAASMTVLLSIDAAGIDCARAIRSVGTRCGVTTTITATKSTVDHIV